MHQTILVNELDAAGTNAGVEEGPVAAPLTPTDTADIWKARIGIVGA